MSLMRERSRVTVECYPRYQVGINTAEVSNKRMMILSLDAVQTFDSGIKSPAVRFEHSSLSIGHLS